MQHLFILVFWQIVIKIMFVLSAILISAIATMLGRDAYLKYKNKNNANYKKAKKNKAA